MERIKLNGARAILWHQGETACVNKEPKQVYKKDLKDLIQRSRKVLGQNIPWLIATVAYHPDTDENVQKDVIDAQKELVQELSNNEVYLGPTTEDITSEKWRFDGVHFSNIGLEEHGQRWANIVLKTFFKEA